MGLPQSTFVHDSSANTEHPVRFLFPVTWSYLSGAGKTGQVRQLAPGMPMLITASAPPAEPPPIAKKDDMSAKWEMVIPKMARPAKPVEAAAPKPIAAANADALMAMVGRVMGAVPAAWRWSVVSAAVVLAAMFVWTLFPTPKATARAAAVVPTAEWVREPAVFAGGGNSRRQLLVYHGSRPAADFRAEFDWKPDARGIGLVFRCTDGSNYQAVRIGLAPGLVAERFTVFEGVETAHVRRPIAWNGSYAPIHFVMEGTSFAFSLYAGNERIDYWTDDRLKTGDVGFYEERNDRGADLVTLTFPGHAVPDFNGNPRLNGNP